MNKPEDMFDIDQMEKIIQREDGSEYRTRSYVLVYKSTGEIHYPKTRKYGYSHLVQAKIARTKLFRSYIKSIEENLLG